MLRVLPQVPLLFQQTHVPVSGHTAMPLHTQDASRRTRVWAFSFANVPHLERA